MPLSPGTRLGVYEVSTKIGEGGMGEVWQARDTKLDREVALKVLPEAFTADPDRLARFEREAKVLASLNRTSPSGLHVCPRNHGAYRDLGVVGTDYNFTGATFSRRKASVWSEVGVVITSNAGALGAVGWTRFFATVARSRSRSRKLCTV